MRISVTERQTYKRCRRKWDYQSYNRQSLSPVLNAPALDLGTLVHSVLADWTAEPHLDPIPLYQTQSQEYFQNLIALYTERIGCTPSMVELQPTLEAITLGLSMITNYKAQWHTPLPPGFSLVQNELSLVQSVPGTEHCACAEQAAKLNIVISRLGTCGTPGVCEDGDCERDECFCGSSCSCVALHELECTFDGIAADDRGDLYIIERKTFSRTPSIDELDNNDQFLAYQWAATQAFSQNIVGVAYDGLLKKKAPSGVHSTLDKLFLRRVLLRNQAELAEFGQQLVGELNEMANPATPIYKTVPPVQGCQRWECQYMDLCHATSKGYPTTDLLKMFVKTDRKSHLNVAAQEPV